MVTVTHNPEWTSDFDLAFRGKYPKPPPTITVAGLPVPCNIVPLPVQILHGRSEFNVQPQAPALSFKVLGSVPWTRNDPVSVDCAGVSRFQGYIDTMTTDFEGGQFVTTLGCVGWQARGGSVFPTEPPMPIEDDVTRATRFLSFYTDAFPAWNGVVLGTETVDLIAIDVDGGNDVLTRLWNICESTGGLLFQSREGELVYGTANHRTEVGALYYIDNCDIVDGIQWVNDAATMVNLVKIKYGNVTGGGNERNEVVLSDTASIALEGPKEVSLDSLIDEELDATLMANLILFRRVEPYWSLPGGIVVRGQDMTQLEYEGLLNLEVSDAVMVRLSREPEAPENLIEWIVEGWVEEWSVEGGELAHTMKIALSDRQRFGLTGIRTVGELAAGFTVGTAAAMTVRDAMFKPIEGLVA